MTSQLFVDDITALLMVENKVLAEMTKKVMKKQREEVERKRASNDQSLRMERKERAR